MCRVLDTFILMIEAASERLECMGSIVRFEDLKDTIKSPNLTLA
jgi:hypothetical protein